MPQDPPDLGTSVLSDDDLHRKATIADNADVFSTLFEEGWESSAVRNAYGRRRHAALAMMVHLAWWTRHDFRQAVRLFERSAFSFEAERPIEHDVELFKRAVSRLGTDAYDPNYHSSEAEP